MLVLLGVAVGDSSEDARSLARRIYGLRIFPDGEGRMNTSLQSTGGEVLVVSQFTLLADTSRGRRPSFSQAADPAVAEPLYEEFCDALVALGVRVATGVFGAYMEVESVNDGPVTLVVEN